MWFLFFLKYFNFEGGYIEMADKKMKMELAEKTEVVRKILKIKNEVYEDWLLKNLNDFITDNVSFLIDMVDKKEAEHEQKEY